MPASRLRSPLLSLSLASAPLLGLLCLSGCTKTSSGPTETPSTTAPATEPATPSDDTVATADDTCRNWSDLDLTTLPELPPTEYTATLEKAWRTVHAKHYDPTLNCQDWPAIRVEYGNKLTEAKSQDEAFGLMREMLGRLGQSHLAITPPRQAVAGEPRAANRATDARAPLAVRVIEGDVVVVDPARDGHRSGVPGGAAIVSIDDNEVAPLLKKLGEHSERQIEADFYARRVVSGWLSCPDTKTKKTVKYTAVGSDKVKTKKVQCRKNEVERVTMGNLANVPVSLEYRMLPDSKIGYLTFNIWLVPLVPRIDAALADLRKQGMESLVLDLRGNPGGVGAMVVPLGRQLLPADASLGEMHMREGKQQFKVKATGDAFDGPVALLVDEGTASTSEIFGQAMQDLGRMKVYGATPSQGAALPSLIEELPGGAILQYVVADYQSPKGIEVEGKGVVPDTVVPETRQDFADGRDPVLDAAVAALRGS